MPDPTSKPPSLVEALKDLARLEPRRGTYHVEMRRDPTGDYLDRDDVLKIAAPYAKRLAALEVVMHHRDKIAECQTILYDDDASYMAQLIAARFTIDQLLSALAAVPEIKETPTDGS